MKIWIDARICDTAWYYNQFICELVETLQAQSSHEIIVYTKENLPFKPGKILDDIKVKKIFEKEKFQLMIFFDHHIPAWYQGKYIVFLESLKEVFFPKKRWIHRKIYSYKLRKVLEKCQSVISLDRGTAMELNENLNIHEDKIRSIPWFFPKYEIQNTSPVHIDIKKKHNLTHEYLIYDSGNEVHNNFERILKTIKKLSEKWVFLHLLVLCEDTTKDLDIRSKVLEYDISKHTLFLGNVARHEEIYYYSQSAGVIFSSIYESFPFEFTKAIAYGCKIFANDIPANRAALWENIYYLDPLSIHNMCDTISRAIEEKNNPVSYDNLELSANNSAQQLTSIIEEKN